MVFRAFRKTVKTPKERRFPPCTVQMFLSENALPRAENPVGHFAGFGEGVTRRQQQPGQV